MLPWRTRHLSFQGGKKKRRARWGRGGVPASSFESFEVGVADETSRLTTSCLS